MNIKKCTNVSGRALHLCKKAHCGKCLSSLPKYSTLRKMFTSCYTIKRVKFLDLLQLNGSMSSEFFVTHLISKTFIQSFRIKLLLTIWLKNKLSFCSFYVLIYCLKARVSIVRKTMVRNHRRAASSPSAKFKYLRKR